jgi:hypothetical protein
VCYHPAQQAFLYISKLSQHSISQVSLSPAAAYWKAPAWPLEFTVVDTPALAEAYFHNKTVVRLHDLFVVYASYHAENFGHFIADELLPAFRAMQLFDAVDSGVHLLRVKYPNPWDFAWTCDWNAAIGDSGKGYYGMDFYDRCTKNYLKLTPLLTSAPAVALNDTLTDPGKVYCFDRMLAGVGKAVGSASTAGLLIFLANMMRPRRRPAGYLSDHCLDRDEHGRYPERLTDHVCNHGMSAQLWQFRSHCLQRVGIQAEAPAGKPKELLVVISTSSTAPKQAASPRNYTGYDEIMTAITNKFSDSRVCGVRVAVRLAHLASMELKAQLQLAAAAAVMVTVSGGGSFNLLFQPRWSTALVFAGNGPRYDREFYAQLGHVSVEFLSHSEDGANVDVAAALKIVGHGLHRFCSMHDFAS